MSQATAPIASVLPARRTPTPQRGPHLEALPRTVRHARPKLFYAALAVLTVMVVVVAQLLLSIGVSQGAYRIESLQATKAQLARADQQASENVEVLSSPQNLAAAASALGMVNNGTPVYLRLSDGAVIGSPAPAGAASGATGGNQLVANALAEQLRQASDPGTATTKADGSAEGDSAASAGDGAQASDAPVPWTGALPAPSTH